MPGIKTASDLYGLPLDEFTPQRNELVKQLKTAGEKDEAARVAKLRKPSTAAWAVNQLVRTQSKRIEALFKAGDAVAKAQAKGQADRLREAAAGQRRELAGLMERAEGLDAEGRTLAANVLERVGETLRAAAIDPESRAQVKDGCLTRELQFTGLAGFTASAAAPSGAASPKANHRAQERSAKERQDELKVAKDRERRAKHDVQDAEKDLRQADRELATAQKARDEAAKNVESAEAALDEASQRLEQLQRGGK